MKSKDMRGVHGWLRLLVFILIVINPLLTWLMTNAQIASSETSMPQLTANEVWRNIKIVSWTSASISSFLGICAGIALLRSTKREVVPYAIAALWVMGPITAMITSFIISNMAGVSAFGDQEILSGIIKSVIFSFIWSAYLMMSQRVHNTYN